MANPTPLELMQKAQVAIEESLYSYGRIGRIEADASVTVNVPGKPGYVYVRTGTDDPTGLTDALCLRAPRLANIPVKMMRVAGFKVIVGVDYTSQHFQPSVHFDVGYHHHGAGSGLGRERDGARAFNVGDISIPDSTATDLTFDSTRYDFGNYYDFANRDRLTAQEEGLYAVTANIAFAHSATGYRRVNLRRSTGLVVASITQQAVTESGIGTVMIATTESYFLAGQYVVCEVYQNSGGALDVVHVDGCSPEFVMTRIG